MRAKGVVFTLGLFFGMTAGLYAGTIADTGSANNLIGVASRPDTNAPFEIETGDDFLATTRVALHSGTFTGLLVGNLTVPAVQSVKLEIYRVFPNDSNTLRIPTFPTRNNSPSDVAFVTY